MSLLKKYGSACCAVGCSMRRHTNLLSKVRLFGFPKDPHRRRLWELAVRRANWKPTPYSKLCNFHFVTGAPSADETHPDYVPTIFKYCRPSTDVKQNISRYDHSIKKEQVKNESLILDNGAPSADEIHPDYVPTIFKYSQQSTDVKQKMSKYERSLMRRQLKNGSLISDNGMSLLKKDGSACCAVGCSMRRRTNLLSKVRLFGFPKDPLRRRLWELAVRRANWKATPYSKLCNFHFVTGEPSSIETHPDYVPTIFKYCQQSINAEQKLLSCERSAKRRRVKNESLILDYGNRSIKRRLKPYAVPSLYLPVTDSEKSSTKYKAATARNGCKKVPNRSVTLTPTTSQKSILLNKSVNKYEFGPIKVSEKDLKLSTIKLWENNEALKKHIESLENEGYKEEHLEWYNDALKEHEYIKDLAKRIMERLADIENTTFTKVQEEFGMR